jgi:thioredoxin reductase (NADPH)
MTDDRQATARCILLATGIVDESPQLPGVADAVAAGSIRFCPVCDGYEATDRRIAVLGHGDDAMRKAKFLRSYSTDVTLLNVDANHVCGAEVRRSLAEAGIKLAGPVTGLSRDGNAIRAALGGAASQSFEVVYPALGCQVCALISPPRSAPPPIK